MRLLDLAKELGISFERLLEWAARKGLPYEKPDEEVDSKDEAGIRRAFSGAFKTRKKKGGGDENRSAEDLLAAEIDGAAGEGEFELPETLEELEALEKELLQVPPELDEEKPKRPRTLTREVLDRYGISGKGAVKKLKKILPGNAARLLNQRDLSDAQLELLTSEIEERAVFVCSHPYCRDALSRRHCPEFLLPVRNASFCSLCRGSPTRRSLEEAAETCRAAGIRRILVVGGMPSSLKEIRDNAPPGVEFRLVAGDLERQGKRVQADLAWCDLAVIWGGTILGHSLSGGYTRRKRAGGPFIVRVNRRSVEALCLEVVRHLEGGREK